MEETKEYARQISELPNEDFSLLQTQLSSPQTTTSHHVPSPHDSSTSTPLTSLLEKLRQETCSSDSGAVSDFDSSVCDRSSTCGSIRSRSSSLVGEDEGLTGVDFLETEKSTSHSKEVPEVPDAGTEPEIARADGILQATSSSESSHKLQSSAMKTGSSTDHREKGTACRHSCTARERTRPSCKTRPNLATDQGQEKLISLDTSSRPTRISGSWTQHDHSREKDWRKGTSKGGRPFRGRGSRSKRQQNINSFRRPWAVSSRTGGKREKGEVGYGREGERTGQRETHRQCKDPPECDWQLRTDADTAFSNHLKVVQFLHSQWQEVCGELHGSTPSYTAHTHS